MCAPDLLSCTSMAVNDRMAATRNGQQLLVQGRLWTPRRGAVLIPVGIPIVMGGEGNNYISRYFLLAFISRGVAPGGVRLAVAVRIPYTLCTRQVARTPVWKS